LANYVLLGVGSTIHPGITKGDSSSVGIGIIKNVTENTSIINFPRGVERKI